MAVGGAPLPDEDNDIRGRLGALSPWQIALILVSVVLVMLAIPLAFRWLLSRNRAHDSQLITGAQQMTDASAGWHDPTWPMTEPKATPATASVPPQPRQALPTPAAPRISMPFSALGHGQQKAQDPQQAAIDSPIEFSSPGAAASAAATRIEENRGATASKTDSALGGLLKPTVLSGYSATRMAHPEWTIEQGRVFSCHNVTPLNSQLPGFVSAKVDNNVWSYDGSNVLIDQNSTLFGEIAHGLADGQDRLFVLWRQVTTPSPYSIRITLNSPAADELGETGLPGDVDHHLWRKLQGALMLSGIDVASSVASAGLEQALTNPGSQTNQMGGVGSSLNFYQFQNQGNQMASQLLAHDMQIPDTLHRDQAMPCSVFVSGDLDFSSVYKDRRASR